MKLQPCVNEFSCRKTRFVLFVFERFSCLGFTPRIANFFLNALDTKTPITRFLLCVFGIKVFDAETSAYSCSAVNAFVLPVTLLLYFLCCLSGFKTSKKAGLKTGFRYFSSFPHAQGFVPRRQNR